MRETLSRELRDFLDALVGRPEILRAAAKRAYVGDHHYLRFPLRHEREWDGSIASHRHLEPGDYAVVGKTLYLHPSTMQDFVHEWLNPGPRHIELARWDDDGGAPRRTGDQER